MVESFNSVLMGIRAMPVNAIVSFTFYRLVAWFNERHAQAMALQSNNQKWAPKPKKHLDKEKERAVTHDNLINITTFKVHDDKLKVHYMTT